ncbi:MAG TPA: VOC family protein [Vicinamibacterales bacterium]|nr:VOC family protein [Vicinamibacterales bacterium]
MPIHPETSIGAVHLTIANLDRSLRFYIDRLGFQLRARQEGMAALGAGGDDLVVLYEAPEAKAAPRTAGLYHFAILVPSRIDLARALRQLAMMQTPMQGFSDHLVSEAIYLADPDGNGIEVYRDRPRAEWQYVDGRLRMATDPLDVEALLREADRDAHGADRAGETMPATVLPAGTRIGHMHLHASFLEDAEEFYTRALGLDVTARYGGSATFMSAGGYHHHVAANTWAGVGAPQPPRGAIGLRHFELRVPDRAARDSAGESLQRAGVSVSSEGEALLVEDPSGHVIAVTPQAPIPPR